MITTLILGVLLAPADTTALLSRNLDEVVVVAGPYTGGKRSVKGSVASIDEHLRELNGVGLVRRGAYAWEPLVNSMQTERLSTTIDGMKIFPACTDRMDPVTSYVESGNLQSISLNSGLYGNPQSTGNIGGSLDFKLRKTGFDNDPFHLNTNIGHEWNGHLQVYGADAACSSHRFYSNFGAFYRHAGSYKAGDGKNIANSQFRKVNVFANLGYRLAGNHVLEGTIIYDRASDVGYPALNMDVKKAEGFITSLSYTRLFDRSAQPLLSSWETKAYYNHITHIMDDSHRPDVEIRMDMPGKSRTAGLYSLLRASTRHHDAALNYDMYYNRQFADMTMYPGGAPMYMVTWPDVGTLNTGLALYDVITLPHQQSVNVSGKISWQTQKLNSKQGYHALKVFFPNMKDSYYQVTGRLAASYAWQPGSWRLSAGAGWGSRAPTVTEAYGYYLNNTFDLYDYIGNPHLKNESAWELNAALGHVLKDARGRQVFDIGVNANAFFFHNYIIGHFDVRLSPMTIGAQGVKVYGNQNHVRIVNVNLTTRWQVLSWLTWNGKAGYSLGKDTNGENLPFISPFSYNTSVGFSYKKFQGQVGVVGNAAHSHYGSVYGESRTPAYTIVNLNSQYAFAIGKKQLAVRIGVENLLDRYYTTYSDWNGIPQKGRNVYANLALSL